MDQTSILRFSEFKLDCANQTLWRNTELLPLRPKTFQFLLYLARNPQRLVTREELLEHVWGASPSAQGLLRVYSFELRHLLGDDPKKPRILETLNGRGYRFLPRVETYAASPPYSVKQTGAVDSETQGSTTPPVSTGSTDSSNAVSADKSELPSQCSAKRRNSTRIENAPPIKVGVLHSLTGTMAYSENPVVDATLLAIDEINRRGGLLGREVQPIVVDGKSETCTFERLAERVIVEDRVSAIFGCWMSAHRKAVVPVVERHDNLLFYPVQYEGLESSPNVFYLGAAPNQQIIPAIRWAFGFLNCKRLYSVGSDYIFPRIANEIVRDEVERLGGTLAGESYIPSGGVDMTALIEQIIAGDPDLIINTINGDSYISFFRSLHAHGLTPERIPVLSFSVGENELRNLDIAGDYAAWNYFQSIDRAENRSFVRAFRARYGPQRVTSDPMESAYVGVHLWAQAVSQCGSSEVALVRDAMRYQSFNAPQGMVQIDPFNQHTWKTIRLGKVIDEGQFDIVYSSEHPIRPEAYPDSRSIEQWRLFLADCSNYSTNNISDQS